MLKVYFLLWFNLLDDAHVSIEDFWLMLDNVFENIVLVS